MSKRTTEILCKAIGVACKWNAEWKEFRVGNFDSLYHTDCPYDAVDTALAIAKWRRDCQGANNAVS